MKVVTLPDGKPLLPGRKYGGNDVMKVLTLPGDKPALPDRETGGNDVMKVVTLLVISPRSQADSKAEMTSGKSSLYL